MTTRLAHAVTSHRDGSKRGNMVELHRIEIALSARQSESARDIQESSHAHHQPNGTHRSRPSRHGAGRVALVAVAMAVAMLSTVNVANAFFDSCLFTDSCTPGFNPFDPYGNTLEGLPNFAPWADDLEGFCDGIELYCFELYFGPIEYTPAPVELQMPEFEIEE
jgi:hypothetical protein